MVVDAVLSLDKTDLNEKLIGIKKVTGGALQDSLFVNGVAFKKTFSYAGFEQQPKSFKDPKIVCLNVELELKSEKDNAEVRVDQVSEYQAIVDAEWQIIYNKMEALYETGAKVVLSKLPIGDLATQLVSLESGFLAQANEWTDTLRIETFFVRVESRPTTSNVWYRRLGAVFRPPVQTFSPNIWDPANALRNVKSVGRDSIFLRDVQLPKRVPWF